MATYSEPPDVDAGARTPVAPDWTTEHAAQVLAARDDPKRLMALFRLSTVPMVMIDGDRHYLEANRAARGVLGLGLEELRRMRVDDLTPPYLHDMLEANMVRLLESGSLMSDEVEAPGGHYLGVTYYGLANVLPARHVLAFLPPGWPAGEPDVRTPKLADGPGLTRREREVLELAADGFNGPRIAKELVLSTATVRTHFGHIYRKLGVPDRAAAIAKAMRLGLIS